MKYDMTLGILVLIISCVFFVTHSFGQITEACLDEIIKTNIMLKALTVTRKEGNKNWNGKIKEHELKRFGDMNFNTLISEEDKIEEITNLLIQDCKGISGVFTKTLIPNGNDNSSGRLKKELKIQKFIRDVVGFKENQLKKNDKDVEKMEKKERYVYFTKQMNKQIRQESANKSDYISAMAERKTALNDYIKTEKNNRKTIQMCNPDSTKCILMGLQKTLDALPDVFNIYTAKCDGEICRITLIQDRVKTTPIYSEHIDEINSEDEYESTELVTDEAGKSGKDEADNSGQTEDEAEKSGQTEGTEEHI
ncbi:uncharacterized protein LOC126840613 isoform X2 [Adelges cooleyi]|uniref:uncharacterized protein LOC126840613 isoform X2 n=1 Tax=Adelges cooleyi TaxID=133065 RepID=UPI00217FA6B9|nr:uncharacterized protein LOC126840613 isoform X2 [Adelges cooleyi]